MLAPISFFEVTSKINGQLRQFPRLNVSSMFLIEVIAEIRC